MLHQGSTNVHTTYMNMHKMYGRKGQTPPGKAETLEI